MRLVTSHTCLPVLLTLPILAFVRVKSCSASYRCEPTAYGRKAAAGLPVPVSDVTRVRFALRSGTLLCLFVFCLDFLVVFSNPVPVKSFEDFGF
jgi:hypothetical protein